MTDRVFPQRLIARPLRGDERDALAQALSKAQLPTDDLNEPGLLFFRFETPEELPVGFGGLEIVGADALLRSVVTLPPVRRRGVGRAIVAALEQEAALRGCRSIYLLTTGAAEYFAKLGYRPCRRDDIPAPIRASRQFVALCPASAGAMTKTIS